MKCRYDFNEKWVIYAPLYNIFDLLQMHIPWIYMYFRRVLFRDCNKIKVYKIFYTFPRRILTYFYFIKISYNSSNYSNILFLCLQSIWTRIDELQLLKIITNSRHKIIPPDFPFRKILTVTSPFVLFVI